MRFFFFMRFTAGFIVWVIKIEPRQKRSTECLEVVAVFVIVSELRGEICTFSAIQEDTASSRLLRWRFHRASSMRRRNP